MLAEFAVPTTIMFFMFVGILLKKYTFIKKTYLPAPILGGIIGFILMNTGVLNLPFHSFERITFHLFAVSFISIAYTGMNTEKGANKGVFRGGLWLGLMFGMVIVIQFVVGGATFLGWNLFTSNDMVPALGSLVAHGFAQGPGQGVAMGTIWQHMGIPGVEHAAQYGLVYAAIGYLIAILIGIPYAKRLIKKRKVSYQIADPADEINFDNGIIEKGEKAIIGKQTAHHSNVDTITLHLALTGGTYFLTYLIIWGFGILIGGYSQSGSAIAYGNIFAWGIILAMIIKTIMKKLKLAYIVDDNFQKSMTGSLVDFLMLTALMSISLKVISEGLIPILITVVIVTAITFFVVRYFATHSDKHQYERFMVCFGLVTGTAATGMLLLRSVDPHFKTPVMQELAWWNILQMVVGLPIVTSQIGMPVTQFSTWFLMMIGLILLYLILLKVFRLWSFKSLV